MTHGYEVKACCQARRNKTATVHAIRSNESRTVLPGIPLFSVCFALAADLVPEALHVHVAAVCSFQHLLGASRSTRRKHTAQQV